LICLIDAAAGDNEPTPVSVFGRSGHDIDQAFDGVRLDSGAQTVDDFDAVDDLHESVLHFPIGAG
jgi:hypothetical protein